MRKLSDCTALQRAEIVDFYKNGERPIEIQRAFDINAPTLYTILSGQQFMTREQILAKKLSGFVGRYSQCLPQTARDEFRTTLIEASEILCK